MATPKVSVTVPVYNTSRYLKQCLDSLASQTLSDIEFIIVDDGSTDGSGGICDEYAARDNRFRVIHQPNGGLSVARQTGLDAAQGEYVIVCDSDDWAAPDMYEKLYQKAKETDADIVCCGYYAEYDGGRSVPKQTIFIEKSEIIDNFDFISRGAGGSWTKLVRKSLFDKAGASYESGINMSEDSLIVYKLMKADPKIVQSNDNLYHYRRLFGGQSYTNNIRMAQIRQLRFTYDWLSVNYKAPQYEPIRFQRAIDISFAYFRVRYIDRDDMRLFMRDELPISRIIKNGKSLKSALAVMGKYLPYNIVKGVVKLLYKYIYK